MPDDQPRRRFQPAISWSGDYPTMGAMPPPPTADPLPPTADSLPSFLLQQPGLMNKLLGVGLKLQSMFGSQPDELPPQPTTPRGDIELPSPRGSMAALRRKTQ